MFKRIGNLIKGLFGLFIGGIEKRNPEALLDVEKENLRKQISEFNKGLATHAALVEKLISQTKKLSKEETALRAKTTANLKAGNRQVAGEYAMKLRSVDAEHDEMVGQLEGAELRYKELVKARDVSVKTAKKKMEELSRNIDDMKVQKAMAEINEMASGMISEIGGAGDSLNRLEEMVTDERNKAAGRARVAKDTIDMGDIHMQAAEEEALAEMALADFAAAEGIDLEPTEQPATEEKPKSETTQGSMGPGVSE